ncbi:MAG: DUF1574 domain-containing protein [Phormidesmis sp. CAN_BIN36]|nr:DUF1574 domain-containing protein [Phormidesmis sp. CAN_BIN36]
MLNVPEHAPSSIKPARDRPSLVQWLNQVVDSPRVQVQVRFRGNNLYILCEGRVCPPRSPLLLRIVRAFAKTKIERFITDDQPQVYQVLLYGRVLGQPRPDWAEVIYLNQIDHHLEKLQSSSERSVDTTQFADPASSSLAIANIQLAKQGRPDAIARYLSESLNSLGVAVRASVKTIPSREGADHSRLWVMCESAYSPDASLMAESIAQKLRDLELTGFQSAIVFSQVHGELQPDWTLRVDLTPPDEMLKAWARWGDPAAISRLIDRTLRDQQIHASATLKDTTLHVSCVGEDPPKQARVMAAIKPLLDTIAPQGIQSAAVYGVAASSNDSSTQPSKLHSPTWVEWLNLPALMHPALSDSTHWLAEKGDIPAIAFLLSRILNPDLDRQLATGGIRIQVRQKEDLLHIMADAPLCPPQNRVGTAIAQFLKPLDIPGVAGVRIYGRRAGQARPAWSYGADFGFRDRLVPAATPEFAASDEYVGDLLTESGGLARRPDLTSDDRDLLDRLLESVQGILTRSQLFKIVTPGNRSLDATRSSQNIKVALVWGALGLLLTVQSDWILGQLLKPKFEPKLPTIGAVSPSPVASDEITLPQISLQKPGIGRGAAFNGSGFTRSGQTVLSTDNPSPTGAIAGVPMSKALVAAQLQQKAVVDAARSPYPTFNTRQLDEKLVLYRQYIEKSGAPDVVVVGSSRAMRGIDPTALQQALAAQGYPGLKIFNFGVNGATAQVVDLIVRRLLPAEKMPKLIIWADGSRAINSGRVDVTYNAIAVSQGFKKIPVDSSSAIAFPVPTDSSLTTSLGTISSTNSVVADSYQTVNTWLNQSLATLSTAYDQRESLRTLFQHEVAAGLKSHSSSEQGTELTIAQDGQGLIDVNGFLPISNRFNPATYYQKYSRVAGNSDGDYADFQLEGGQSAAIASLVTFTQSQKIPLVFINLPLSGEYLDSVRRGHEQAFQEYMLRTSAELGFTYRNLTEEWKTEHDFFSDPSHLNRYGAFAVANHIAKDPLIPWAKR